MYLPPPDFLPMRTKDGSFTLRSEQLGEQYHSLHGAVKESRHVYVEAGLKQAKGERIDVLEIGLGTGLNALLTWIHAEEQGLQVRYTALEPFPLSAGTLRHTDHAANLGMPDRTSAFLEMMMAEPEVEQHISDAFAFTRSPLSVLHFDQEALFDVVYFDAFGPTVQPELWTEDVFRRMHLALRPGGTLVTYCAKGSVRRAMIAGGFRVERMKAMWGKREMFRARRPL